MLNLKNTNPQRICKLDKQIAGNLDYSDTEFPINIHDYEKIEERFHMCINVSFLKRRAIKYLMCY